MKNLNDILVGVKTFDIWHQSIDEHEVMCADECCKPGNIGARPAAEWEPMMFVSHRHFSTFEEAEQDFLTVLQKFIRDKKPTQIAWRIRPETSYYINFNSFNSGYVTYARFFYHT